MREFLILCLISFLSLLIAQKKLKANTSHQFISNTINLRDSLKENSQELSSIEGYIYEETSGQPISFATIQILNTNKGSYSDENGFYTISNLPTGVYDIEASFIGFEQSLPQKITLTKGNTKKLNFFLNNDTHLLETVVVKPNKRLTQLTQNTLKLSKEIILKIPSGDDIIQVFKALPGISKPPGFSNELNIRGGASFENSFLIDGIRLPVIDHYSNNGLNNGFRSILNNQVLESATLHTNIFPIQLSNVSSAVFDFKIMEANEKKFEKKLILGTSDVAMTLNGPIADNKSIVFSFRQSYLKPTLKLLDRAILSTYNDWLYKMQWDISHQHKISIVGVGSYDTTEKNLNSNRNLVNQYILDRFSPQKNWHATNAFKYQNIRQTGITSIILANYFLDVKNKKIPNGLINSIERGFESKTMNTTLNIENVTHWKSFRFKIGGQIQHTRYQAHSFINWPNESNNFGNSSTTLSPIQWSAFLQFSQIVKQRFHWIVGLKVDADNFINFSPLDQFSPRLSLAYFLSKKWAIRFNGATYHQLPPLIGLAYRDTDNLLVNQENMDYFTSKHWNIELKLGEEQKTSVFKLTLFQKKYSAYPYSINDQTILSATSNGFSNYAPTFLQATGKSEAQGLEIAWQLKPRKNFYGIINYTLSWSKFTDQQEKQLPTNFDARHILNVIGSQQFGGNWQVGFTFRLQSGLPYTPWDIPTSSNQNIWNQSLHFGVLDFAQVNARRAAWYGSVDIRVDKSWQFKSTNLKAYIDLLNLRLTKNPLGRSLLLSQKDNNGEILINERQPNEYLLQLVENRISTVVPSIGVAFSF